MPDLIKVVNMIPNLSSGETNQDSEPNIAVNPANPLEMAATAFTPSPNVGSTNSPIFYSNDGGNTWGLRDIIAGTPVRDQTLRFASTSGMLYAGVLWGGGNNIALINFDILRTNDFSGLTTMTNLASRKNDDQPFVQAATVPAGSDAGKDRIYVGSNDHAPSNIPATVDLSLDAAAAVPPVATFRIEGRTVSRDGFQTRPAVHTNGIVYAIFYALIGGSSSCDVVIVRDDNWASGATPFNALVDTGDSKQGVRIVTGVNNPFLTLNIGQQRIGGDLSIAVDPNNSATVYVCWGDLQSSVYTLHVRKSTDSGATWSADLRTISNATNPALAINNKGRLGFLYQQVTGTAPNQRWQTTLEFTTSDFASLTTDFLANTPSTTPSKSFDPYLGDYLYMMTVGSDFYGIFCANNTPDMANFPNGVVYQRNANFSTHTLLNADNVTPVSASIDPFFFKVTVGAGAVTTAIASGGKFGHVCLGSFVDELLTINNSGSGPLTISNILSSSPDFLTPDVIAYPIKVGVGDSVEVVIRFQPTSLGSKSATLTVISDDPAGPHKIPVSGDAQAPKLNLVIANTGNFGKVCVGSFVDEMLTLNNSGHCTLLVTGITSSSAEFLVPNVLSYPLAVEAGSSLQVPIRLRPTSFGPKSATITVASNDPASPRIVAVSGTAPAPVLALMVANNGNFGNVCIGSFVDKPLTLLNSGECTLTIMSIASSASEFVVPHVLTYPIRIAPGTAVEVPIRFEPASFGTKSGTITITSDDPTGAKSVTLSGNVPSGKLVVTGSTCIGGVKACCLGERTISICNVGDCNLHVTSVAFKRKNKHWKLINNPFPATLHPGSCLSVLIRYKATEKCPRSCELVITSDDPVTPVKTLDVMAYTIWNDCGCRKCCDDCRKGCCEKHHDEGCSAQGLDACCDDEGEDDDDDDGDDDD